MMELEISFLGTAYPHLKGYFAHGGMFHFSEENALKKWVFSFQEMKESGLTACQWENLVGVPVRMVWKPYPYRNTDLIPEEIFFGIVRNTEPCTLWIERTF